MPPEALEILLEQVRDLVVAVHTVAELARQQPPTEPQSSVELARNSKGAVWTVKVYGRDPVEASTLAQGLYDQLACRYGGAEREREP
jgi:hypothetical protein